jgi:hypothetical protein
MALAFNCQTALLMSHCLTLQAVVDSQGHLVAQANLRGTMAVMDPVSEAGHSNSRNRHVVHAFLGMSYRLRVQVMPPFSHSVRLQSPPKPHCGQHVCTSTIFYQRVHVLPAYTPHPQVELIRLLDLEVDTSAAQAAATSATQPAAIGMVRQRGRPRGFCEYVIVAQSWTLSNDMRVNQTPPVHTC